MPAFLRSHFLLFLCGFTLALPANAATLYGLEQVLDAQYFTQRLITIETDTGQRSQIGIVTIEGTDPPVNAPFTNGGLDFDSNGDLYWLGLETHIPGSTTGSSLNLYKIDIRDASVTKIAVLFEYLDVNDPRQSVESFTIVKDRGYTIRHVRRDRTWIAQLYEVDLSDGTTQKIGSGFRIGLTDLFEKDKIGGLTSDGSNLYLTRYDGRLERLDFATGSVVFTIRDSAQAGEERITLGTNIAFANGRLWILEKDDKLYELDPDDGTARLVHDGQADRSWVDSLAAKDTVSFRSVTGVSLVADASELDFTRHGDAFPKKAGTVFASAPLKLAHGDVIESLRCTVSAVGKQHVSAAIKRTRLSDRSTLNSAPETVVSVNSAGGLSTDLIVLSGKPGLASARVDNRHYGYFLQVGFVGSRSWSLAEDPADADEPPSLFFRGCVINVH